MKPTNSSCLARILAAPWQQRLGANGRWSLLLVVVACLSVPVVLLVLGLLGGPGPRADALIAGAARSTWICLFALPVVAWVILVGNVLQQNHPTFARLVPHHRGQLRTALLVGWAMVSLSAAALPGFAFGAPLAWACGAAGGLALLAAAIRWPMLCLGGLAAPFLVDALTRRFDAAGLGEAIWAAWAADEYLWTAMVVTAGALILVVMVRGGGARHRASYASRQRLRNAGQPAQRGGWALPGSSRRAWMGGLSAAGDPYGWWLDRLLARPDSPVMSRLLAGLGPATHWTSRLVESVSFLVIGGGICLVMASVFGGALRSGVLPWVAYSVLAGVCTNALQAVPRLPQTRREQALLVLLPGVPRGARLNRWLAWQMSGVFVVATLAGFALTWALNARADALHASEVARVAGGMTAGMAAALLPQVAWQWRRWARMRAATTFNQTVPVFAAVLAGGAVMALHAAVGLGYVASGMTLALAAIVYCAWRWWRMGSEPSALPVGRLA